VAHRLFKPFANFGKDNSKTIRDAKLPPFRFTGTLDKLTITLETPKLIAEEWGAFRSKNATGQERGAVVPVSRWQIARGVSAWGTVRVK
jgi:hypothetical protein